VSARPSLLTPPAAPLLAGEPTPSSTFGAPSSTVEQELSSALSAPVLGAPPEATSLQPPADPFAAASSAEPVSSAEPAAPEPVQSAGVSAPMPFAMPPQMAAARSRPAPRPTPPAPAPTTDTGL
jgi:hypothetical protein